MFVIFEELICVSGLAVNAWKTKSIHNFGCTEIIREDANQIEVTEYRIQKELLFANFEGCILGCTQVAYSIA
jgi:hypothetical protein